MIRKVLGIIMVFVVMIFLFSCSNDSNNLNQESSDNDTENTDFDNTESSGNPVISWTKQWGTEKNDWDISVATGIDGSIYVAGYIINNIGGGDVDYDLFLTKFNSDGTEKWTKQWGTEEYDYGNSVTVGSDGSIYVTGHSLGIFDGNTVSGCFLTKFSDDGTVRWTKQWEGVGHSVAIGKDDSIYITGLRTGGLDDNTIKGWSDVFLIKLDSDGIKEWDKQWGTERGDIGYSVALGDDGSIFVAGIMDSDYDEYGDCGESIFLTKFKSDGTEEWTKQWGTEYCDFGSSVVVGSDGFIYVTGYTAGNLDGNSSEGREDVFLTKFSSDGTKEWTKLWGTQSNDRGYSMAVGKSGSIYLAGLTFGEIDGNKSEGAEDVFLTKFSNDGVKKWTKQWGTPSSDRGYSIAAGSDGSIYVTGLTGGSFNEFINKGGWDFFLTKIIEE